MNSKDGKQVKQLISFPVFFLPAPMFSSRAGSLFSAVSLFALSPYIALKNHSLMKTLPTVLFLLLSLATETKCQVIGYYLPEKKLQITVTYTIKGYALKGVSSEGKEENTDRKYEMFIEDDIKVEEIVVPDRNRYFEVTLPGSLSKGGARFEWSLKLDRNGILAGWNASREPITAAVLSGGIGLVTNVLTGFTQLNGVLPGLTEQSYSIATDQEITVTEIVDIPATGIPQRTVAMPQIDTAIANHLPAIPKVSISVIDAGIVENPSPGDMTKSRDVLYYIAPKHYRLSVNVSNNGVLENGKVIDNLLVVPQHGLLKQIPLSALFKGRKTAKIALDPTTGQLLSWQYAREGNTKNDLGEINRQLESLSAAIVDLRAAKDQRLENEVNRLELQLQKLELLRELEE